MADEVVINSDGRTLEIIENEDTNASKLMSKIDILEQEKGVLVRENVAVRERITKLEGEIEELERETAKLGTKIERLDADKKLLEVVAARTDGLDFEVWKLQRDIITAETDGVEANKQLSELKREVERLKVVDIEKSEKLEVLEKEKALLLKKLDEVESELRDGNKVREGRVREFKNKLEDFKGRASDLIVEIGKRDGEIGELEKSFVDQELVVGRNSAEMGKLKEEREEMENAKIRLQELLEYSEACVKEMEEKLGKLGEEIELSERVISGLKEKTLDGINGIHVTEDGEKGTYGLKLHWPLLVASTGVIVTVGALRYMRARQR